MGRAAGGWETFACFVFLLFLSPSLPPCRPNPPRASTSTSSHRPPPKTGADGQPQIYQIDPSGNYFAWKANAIGGRNFKPMKEFLEKEWVEGLTEGDSLKLTVKALLEVVDSGTKNMEIVVLRKGQPMQTLDDDALSAVVTEVEAELEEAKTGGGAEEMKE